MISNVRLELASFARFLRRPRRTPAVSASAVGASQRVLLFLLLILAFDLVIAFPIETVLEKWFQLTSVLNIDSLPIILWALVVAPILEELVFRAGLRNARYCLFAGPPLMLMFCRAEWQVLLGLIAVIILIAAGSAWYDGQKDKRGLTGYRFARARRFLGLYPWIFWLFTISFALVHASNFVSSDRMGLIPFFAVSSQLVAGVVFGYLRLRDGLKSAIALHFANNLVALTLSVLLG